MEDEAIITHLTQIKGVGRWTVEMLLMFGLGREDIFAIDDWGVQNAMIHIYKLDRTDKKAFREALLRLSQKWSPYRTYACMHLWRWKDNSPTTAIPVTPGAKRSRIPSAGTPAKKSRTRSASTPAKKLRSKTAPAKKASTKTTPAKKTRPGKPAR
jgi:hypothetical protein